MEISDKLLAELIRLGVEGVEYWADVVTSSTGETPALDKMVICCEETGQVYQVTTETTRDGVRRAIAAAAYEALAKPSHAGKWSSLIDAVTDNDATLLDPEVADLVVQYGLFGEMRYT